jgi:F-type H+-transporting ATPase subunit a
MVAVAAGEPTIDVMGQFKLATVFGPIGNAVSFTQANLFMLIGGALTLGLLYFGMRPKSIVPGRLQSLAEMLYDFIHSMCIDQIGHEGRRYFPFVFTLFTFVLLGNLLGLLPWSFTYTSHIAVTFALAITVIVLATAVAILTHGTTFFTEYFFPKGVPIVLAPLIVPVEIISYLSRPVSLSVRLFANMVAGHMMFEVFGAFVVMLAGAGAVGIVAAVLPMGFNVVLVGFELLVACLQAYVFAILTCIYLHDAVHLH